MAAGWQVGESKRQRGGRAAKVLFCCSEVGVHGCGGRWFAGSGTPGSSAACALEAGHGPARASLTPYGLNFAGLTVPTTVCSIALMPGPLATDASSDPNISDTSCRRLAVILAMRCRRPVSQPPGKEGEGGQARNRQGQAQGGVRGVGQPAAHGRYCIFYGCDRAARKSK